MKDVERIINRRMFMKNGIWFFGNRDASNRLKWQSWKNGLVDDFFRGGGLLEGLMRLWNRDD